MSNDLLEGRNIVLQKTDGILFYGERRSLPIEAVSGHIPNGYSIWRVQSYHPESATLVLRIESGIVEHRHFTMSSKVNDEAFEGITVSKIVLNRAGNIVAHSSVANVRGVSTGRASTFQPERTHSIPEPVQPEEVQIKKQTYHLSVKVNDTEFVDGKVVFSVPIPEPRKWLELEMPNPFVRMAFDPVKKYFAKFFPNSEFQIVVDVAYKGTDVVDKTVTSADIASINEEMISRVNDVVIGRSLRDISEDDFVEIGSLTTLLNEQDPRRREEANLQTLIQEGKTKHYHHLSYLSERHDRDLCKLKLTAKPTSFISVLREGDSTFVVWEPYNTDEATYLWRIRGRDDRETLKVIADIENSVKLMRRSQKMAYRKQEKDNRDFLVIEHNYTLPKNGFDVWLQEVEDFLRS